MTAKKTPKQKSSSERAAAAGKRVVMLAIDTELVERIDAAAELDGRSRNNWVVRALAAALAGGGISAKSQSQ